MSSWTTTSDTVARWRVIELHLDAPVKFANPFQDARLTATILAPSGRQILCQGFWNGEDDWCVRFMPDEEGQWHYSLRMTYSDGAEIVSHAGQFTCTANRTDTVFDRHGPVRLGEQKRLLMHADGTPFFWLADTAWNGPLLATREEWHVYLETRKRQKFSAVQWVATHWRAAPHGDRAGRHAFAGHDRITVNPAFFIRLDKFLDATTQVGLLNVPVMLWAIGAGDNPTVDPGFGLPEDQAVLLTRYMVARWAAYPLAWILAGDGKYFGDYAARWRRIGRAVFADHGEPPVAMHCGGEQWPADEFRGELWCDILGYQSGHGDADKTWDWIVHGPPATDWAKVPRLFQINLEPAYENHVAYQSGQPHAPHNVRTAMYWSLLNAPTAGVSYGGHGVWGWDDGTHAPTDHPRSGIPLPWREALTMPAAEQVSHLVDFFTSITWWTLTPTPDMLAHQPGDEDVRHTILAARDDAGTLAAVYMPFGGTLQLNAAQLAANVIGTWCNPRTGERQSAAPRTNDTDLLAFASPDDEDWLLLLTSDSE